LAADPIDAVLEAKPPKVLFVDEAPPTPGDHLSEAGRK
jgi:hypothetical protein